jgi:hypothetical protein
MPLLMPPIRLGWMGFAYDKKNLEKSGLSPPYAPEVISFKASPTILPAISKNPTL